jgi:hypothetical protein
MSTETGEAKAKTPSSREARTSRIRRLGLSLSLSVAFTFGMVGGLGACPGTLSDPARFADSGSTESCSEFVDTELSTVCAASGCHTTAGMAGLLDLQAPDVYARLTGKNASGGPGFLIAPNGDPDASVLYLKLTSNPPFGSQMPLIGSKLDSHGLACFASWIMAGGHPGDGGAGMDSPVAETAPPEEAAAEASVDGGTDGDADAGSAPDEGVHEASADSSEGG